MNLKRTLIALFLGASLAACNSNEEYLDISQPIVFDFAQESHEFTPFFSDYPQSTSDTNNEELYQLDATYGAKSTQDDTNNAWRLFGNNHSDDLFMSIKGQIEGLKSNKVYRVEMSVDLTTDVPENCFGIGGAPGESVYVKLAASTEEPNSDIVDGMNRVNIDIGHQSNSGTEGQVVGNISNGVDCSERFRYEPKTLTTTSAIDVMTDVDGNFWVLAGTDSGFEGLTYYYIDRIVVTISE